MADIKTATAWGYITRSGGINCETTCVEGQYGNNDPVVIVHGMTEAEVHEAAALLAKSREVCEQKKITHDGPYQFRAFGGDCDNDHYSWNDPNECPSWCEKVGSCDSLFTWHDELTRRIGEYIEAYDYAKSIGAIE